MSDAPEAPCEPLPGHWSAPLAQRQLQRLDELAEIGLDCARAIARQAQADEPPVADLALAYSRVSRAVRLTLLLQSKLVDALKAAERQAADLAARTHPVNVKKARVERAIERLAEAEHPDDEDEIERLVAEAGERLDDEDDADILERPFEEIVQRICEDLGLHPTSPMRSMAGGGPLAERSEERGVEGEGLRRDSLPYALRDSPWLGAEMPLAPSTTRSSAGGPPPAACGGGGGDARAPPTPSTPAPMPDWF